MSNFETKEILFFQPTFSFRVLIEVASEAERFEED